MQDRAVRERRRINEIRKVFKRYWGPVLPADDAGRDAVRLIADHLAPLPDGRDRFVNFAETHADWLPEGERDEIFDAAACARRRWTDEQIGRELNLSFEIRTELGIGTIAAADMTRAEVKRAQADRKNEKQRLKRLAQRARREKAPGATDPFTARKRSLLTALAAGPHLQTEKELRGMIGSQPCWTDRLGARLASESLRRLIRLELDALIAAGAVIEGDRVPTKFNTEARRFGLAESGTARPEIPASRHPGSWRKTG